MIFYINKFPLFKLFIKYLFYLINNFNFNYILIFYLIEYNNQI